MNRDRDAIARIIDPEAWEFADKWTGEAWPMMRGEVAHETGPSLAKADAILALPAEGGVTDTPALLDEVERLQRTSGAVQNAQFKAIEHFSAHAAALAGALDYILKSETLHQGGDEAAVLALSAYRGDET